LSDKQVFDFLFAPGFSTAEKVTDVSGRGVGMDVVKTNLDKIKGVIDIETKEGQGTSLTISIPISTAITDGMIFKIESEYYILPIESLIKIIDIRPSDLVKLPTGEEIIKFRNQIYPFFRLEDVFDDQRPLVDSGCEQLSHIESDTIRVILFDTTKQIVAVRIDEVLGKTKAILRTLDEDLKKSDGVSGASLLGNGHLALVLDPLGLERAFSSGMKGRPMLEGAA
jgi:two-component system chemotaxis sensor kinase CheA